MLPSHNLYPNTNRTIDAAILINKACKKSWRPKHAKECTQNILFYFFCSFFYSINVGKEEASEVRKEEKKRYEGLEKKKKEREKGED